MDWHDHQKQVQDKLKAEIANKEVVIRDLMRLNQDYADKIHLLNRICTQKQATEEDLLRLNEKYADEIATLKKEKERK